jgi:hypothetical protein
LGDGSHRPTAFYREDELEEIEVAKAAPINTDRMRPAEVLTEFPSLTWKKINQAIGEGRVDKPQKRRVKVGTSGGRTTIQSRFTLSRSQLRQLADADLVSNVRDGKGPRFYRLREPKI